MNLNKDSFLIKENSGALRNFLNKFETFVNKIRNCEKINGNENEIFLLRNNIP